MNLSNELLLTMNGIGWGLVIWLGKRQFDGLADKVEAVTDKVSGMVTRGECQGVHNRIHSRIDEIDVKSDSQGERIARLEVVSGK